MSLFGVQLFARGAAAFFLVLLLLLRRNRLICRCCKSLCGKGLSTAEDYSPLPARPHGRHRTGLPFALTGHNLLSRHILYSYRSSVPAEQSCLICSAQWGHLYRNQHNYRQNKRLSVFEALLKKSYHIQPSVTSLAAAT